MLLVGKDVKYAASGAVVNAALTPDLLDAGAIGIYTVGSDGKLKLVVTSGTTPAANLILSTAVKKQDKITMFVGLGSGKQYTSEAHDVNNIQKVLGSVYRAGAGQTAYIGFDGTSGDLNVQLLPSQLQNVNGLVYSNPDALYRQEATIKFRRRLKGNNEFGNLHYVSVPVVPTDTPTSIAGKFVTAFNQIAPYETEQFFTASLTGAFLPAPVQTTPATATTGGTVPAGTYYATVVAYGTAGNSLGSNQVSQVTTGSTSTLTFNWVAVPNATGYRVFVSTSSGNYSVYYPASGQATATLTITAIAGTAGTVPTSSALGIKLVAIDTLSTFAISVFGVIDNATVNQGGRLVPSGTPAQILELEKDSMPYRGDLYTLSMLDEHLPSQVDTAVNYDLYQIQTINKTRSKTGSEAETTTEINTFVAFAVQGNVVDTNQQANFEDIMTDIFPGTAQIS